MATIVVGTDGSKGSEAALSEAVDLAKRLDAKLVVVGTRGLGALAGSLLGSVSSELVRRSSRPMVVVREPG